MMYKVVIDPLDKILEICSDHSLLDELRDAGVRVVTPCGGLGLCGKCRIKLLDGALSKPTKAEIYTLSSEELEVGYRLACQCHPLSDIKIEIPLPSLATGQRLQLEGIKTEISLNPDIKSIDVKMDPPSAEDLRSDASRLVQALSKAHPDSFSITHSLLQDFSTRIREKDLNWQAKVAIRDSEIVDVLPLDDPLLGMAVDIGTTKIATYLINLGTGEVVAQGGIVNPQVELGEDVLSRIAFANLHQDGRGKLQTLVVENLNALLVKLCGSIETKPQKIVDAVIVGNTAMHHLFSGLPVRQLGFSPYVPAVSDAFIFPAREVGLELAPSANIYMPPNIAGFVGADHVAMLLATQLHRTKKTKIGVDIGTNTEITLATGGRLMSCSTASGPAFEGAHIHDGMRAVPGAIEKVVIRGDSIYLSTIDEAPPIGICGSGILDAVAEMFMSGSLDRSGKLINRSNSRRGFVKSFTLVTEEEAGHDHPVQIMAKDVREVQLAKGAIRAGIEILLNEAGMHYDEIDEIVVAGAFGTYLDVGSAINIGMFPSLPREKFRQVGNAAGEGAKRMLLSKEERKEAEKVKNDIEYIELTTHPDFRDVFLDSLYLGELE